MSAQWGKPRGKDIILAILDNMDESSEPLLFKTLVPSHYDVYLHGDDYNRLSRVFSRIHEEVVLALDEKLASLNKKGLSFLPGHKSSKTVYEAAEKSWSVKFHLDENEDLAPGDVLVDSQLALPAPVEYGVGTKTQRSETIRSGGETRKLKRESEKNAGSAALAKLLYKDKNGQDQEYLMSSAEISVGRGGRNEFCDLELDGPADIPASIFISGRIRRPGSSSSRMSVSSGLPLTGKSWRRNSGFACHPKPR